MIKVRLERVFRWICPNCGHTNTGQGQEFVPDQDDQWQQPELQDPGDGTSVFEIEPNSVLCAGCLDLFEVDHGEEPDQ